MNFFEQFGIQPILLAAQAVNFLILLFLLNKFLYRPIIKVIDERRQKIAEGVESAEKITAELQKIEDTKNSKIEQAIAEAGQLITDAKTESVNIIENAKTQAETQVQDMLENARQQIQLEHQKMQQSLRAEVSQLVVASLEKIITTELSAKDRTRITQKIAKEFKN